MAAPTAIGAIGLGSSLVGGIFKGIGASERADANAAMYSYQAGIAEYNRKVALQNADYSRMVGEQKAMLYGMKAGQEYAGAKAGRAASGLDVNSGSSVDVLNSIRSVAKIDTDQIRANAAKTAYDYEVAASGDAMQAQVYNMASSNARRAGEIDMMGSIIGTAESVSSKWLQGRSAGLWG